MTTRRDRKQQKKMTTRRDRKQQKKTRKNRRYRKITMRGGKGLAIGDEVKYNNFTYKIKNITNDIRMEDKRYDLGMEDEEYKKAQKETDEYNTRIDQIQTDDMSSGQNIEKWSSPLQEYKNVSYEDIINQNKQLIHNLTKINE
jgi:hypothetical protein